jgi:hypothetical protein
MKKALCSALLSLVLSLCVVFPSYAHDHYYSLYNKTLMSITTEQCVYDAGCTITGYHYYCVYRCSCGATYSQNQDEYHHSVNHS